MIRALASSFFGVGCNVGRRHHEEQFCEIILNLDQWFMRRCHLKDFLSGALAALMFGGAEPFVLF